MMNKIKNLIRTGVNLSTDDSGLIRKAFVKWQGKPSGQSVESLVPFGTFGKPLKNSEEILLQRKGDEARVATITCDPVNRIKKDCTNGEYGVGNNKTKAYTYYKDDETIESQTGDLTVTFHPGGKLQISGSSEEMISVINEWMTNIISAKVVTGIGLQPFSPDTIANLTTTQLKFQQFKV